MTDPFMESGNAPAIKFANVGDIRAIVVRRVDKKIDQAPNGEVKTWANGDPQHVFVFNGEDDQGEDAALWVRGNMVKAIRDATTKAGLASVIDTKVTVKFTGLGEAKRGMNAPKLFAAKVEQVAPKIADPFGDDTGFDDDLEAPF